MKALRHEGTCQWLLDDPLFKTWEASRPGPSTPKGQHILWLHGKAGNGKSVLASAVAQSLQDSAQARLVVYFFFAGKTGMIECIRALIRQLVTIIDAKHMKLPEEFTEFLDQCGGTLLCYMHTAIKALISLLNICPRVHVVLDGLDECTDRMMYYDSTAQRPMLAGVLSSLVNHNYNGIVKWFFTSSPEPDLNGFFQDVQAAEIELTRQRVERDVATYMNARLRKLEYWVSDAKFRLSVLGGNRIAEGGFNFLDAKITFNLLERNPGVTQEDIHEILCSYEEYGKDFNSRYLRGLLALKGKSEKERIFARQAILARTYCSGRY